MIKGISIFSFLICIANGLFGQIQQTHMYELEKKNYDDYFTVLPAGENGVIIFRDTDEYKKGEVWQVVSLDTTLTERWNNELIIDSKYNFMGYELKDSLLYLIYRKGDIPKSDYHILSISVLTGIVKWFDIKNGIDLEPSHISILTNRIVLAGYVNYSPTIIACSFDHDRFEVIPGFFKDRSNIVDLRDNGNHTFNTVTLEKEYQGSFLRLKTYSYEGDLLFEKTVETDEGYHIRSAKSSGFINGNFVIAGTYSIRKSYDAAGIYLVVVKPEGQKNLVKFYSFDQIDHYFDYLKPRAAARLKAKFQRRSAKGKNISYSAKILLNDIVKSDDGYLIAAEVFNAEYLKATRTAYDDIFQTKQDFDRRSRSAQSYAKQPSTLQNVDNADTFNYLESFILQTDAKGQILWNNSFKIEDVETLSLEQIVHFKGENEVINLLYKSEKDIKYKIIDGPETVEEGIESVKLKYEFDKVVHTYKGIGRSLNWYDNNFLIWGYQKIENKVNVDDKNRSVLFVNKVVFK